MTPISVLDLSLITEGGDAATALSNTRDLAQHAEAWGYRRYWVAEHHNMPGIASAATAVVIGHVASGTATIRVGAGGIMLPNHAPLIIAEQFGTLASLYPGRIDLGIGRAPGTDRMTASACGGTLPAMSRIFRATCANCSTPSSPQLGQQVHAVPGAGLHVPLWILGSSLYGAQLAAAFGLPYAFASHFARRVDAGSQRVSQSLSALGTALHPVCDGGLERLRGRNGRRSALSAAAQQSLLNVRRGQPSRLPPPWNTSTASLHRRSAHCSPQPTPAR